MITNHSTCIFPLVFVKKMSIQQIFKYGEQFNRYPHQYSLLLTILLISRNFNVFGTL